MVVTEIGDGQAQESHTSRMVRVIDARNRARLDYDYSSVPWEIWFEILSRLNIKPLFVCQVVCKLWREIVFHVTKNIEPLPLCGLVFRKGLGPHVYVDAEHFHTTYFCLTTKATLDHRELSIASGYDQGLIAELKFDFSALGVVNNSSISERKPTSLTSHKGLLLVDYSDGTYEVHNPVTRQVCTVPMSELSRKYGAPTSIRESCGLIINLSDRPGIECSFVIVRFSRKFNKIEMYYSVTKRWSVIVGLKNVVVRGVGWSLENYVAIYKPKTLSFYFLTNANHGVVSNFRNLSVPKAKSFAFPLPNSPLLHWNNGNHRKIWESEKTLFLSYCDPTRLKIWKAGSTGFDKTLTWVPQLEISNSDPLRNVVGSGKDDIVKFLKAGGPLKPVAFHPYDPIIYLLVEENIFGYNIVNDTIVNIAKINEVELFKNANAILGYPFIPCITSFHDAKSQQEVA